MWWMAVLAAVTVLDFETPESFRIVQKRDDETGVRGATSAFATSGEKSLRLGMTKEFIAKSDFCVVGVEWTDPAFNDFTPYDRLAVDVVNFSPNGKRGSFYPAGPDGRNTKARIPLEFKPWETTTFVARLDDWKAHGADLREMRGFSIATANPSESFLYLDNFRLLKPGEEVVRPDFTRFQAEIAKERAEIDRRLAAEREREERAARERHRKAHAAYCAACGRPRGMIVATASSMDQIRPRDTDFAKLRPAADLKLRLARGEYESLQVAVTAADGLKGVRVETEGFPFAVKPRIVGYTNAKDPARYPQAYCEKSDAPCGYVRKVRPTPTGWYADPVMDFMGARPVDVAPGDVQSFLITATAPRDAAAGTYVGKVRVTAEGEAPFEAELAVRVYGFEVPKVSELPLLVSFTPYVQPLSLSWTEEQAEARRRDPEAPVNLWKRHREEWADFLAEYFIGPGTIYSPWGGASVPDFDLIQREHRRGRLGHFVFGSWGPVSDEAWWRRHRLPLLRRRYEQVKAAGLLDKALLYGCDETEPEHFAVVSNSVALYKREFPDVPLATTCVDPSCGTASPLAGIDWFAPLTPAYKEDVAAKARSQGRQVWWYTACGEKAPLANFFVENPLADGRLLVGAQSLRVKADGFLYYAVAKWNQPRPITSGPFTDWSPVGIHHIGDRALHGDGVWAYCGPDGVPVATLRMENFRDGLEDYAYAKALERALARHAGGNDAWAQEARRLLAVPPSVMDTLKNFTDSAETVYAWRDRMAELLEASRPPIEVPERHRPLAIMGRDFWHGLNRPARNVPWKTGNPEVDGHPAFADAIFAYSASAQPPPPTVDNAVWPRIEDYFLPNDPDRWILETCPDPTRPFFISRSCERRRTTWGSPVRIDLEAYRAWRAKRPNLMTDGGVSEWCNDLNNAWSTLAGKRGMYVNNMPDSTNRFLALKRFMGERPKTRYEHLALLKRFWAMRKERNFDGRMSALDAHLNSLHIAADLGAVYLRMETTASGRYRYQPSAMFTRGAARQFGVPWEWYVAGYMNGPSKRYPGDLLGDAMCRYPQTAAASGEPRYAAKSGKMRIGNGGPDFGISRSVFNRTHYLAYLSGANVLWLEEWNCVLRQWDRAANRPGLSPRGRLYADFVDFTVAHPDRGAHYSPVAVCVPLAQGYPTWGGHPFAEPRFGYTDGDKAVDAVFYTLVPGGDFGAGLAHGEERLLVNSPYADMYDVIVPDAESQTPERLLAVMKSYKALVVVGDYPDRRWEATLGKYEQAGGKVVRVDAAMLADEAKTGRGRGIASGETRYPKLEAALKGLQSDYFPFEVAGDCSYGLTVADGHLWLYVFNNDGVTKFADAPEELDASKAVDVTVSLRPGRGSLRKVTELLSGQDVAVAGGASFGCRLGPGELAIFEIK